MHIFNLINFCQNNSCVFIHCVSIAPIYDNLSKVKKQNVKWFTFSEKHQI